MKMIPPFFLFFTLLSVLLLSSCIWDSDEKKSFCHKNPSKCYEFTDERDGQVYTWVTIGEQNWMAENLNYDTADGVGSWCYDNDPKNCEKYGRLYVWNTAMAGASTSSATPSGVRGICPVGWHVPSSDEWEVLIEFVGGRDVAASQLKSATDWNGDDEYGFSAIPAGAYFENDFWHLTLAVTFWSSTRRNQQFILATTFWNDYLLGMQSDYDTGHSLRCLQD